MIAKGRPQRLLHRHPGEVPLTAARRLRAHEANGWIYPGFACHADARRGTDRWRWRGVHQIRPSALAPRGGRSKGELDVTTLYANAGRGRCCARHSLVRSPPKRAIGFGGNYGGETDAQDRPRTL